MRVSGAVFFLAAFAATQASASSIVALAPSTTWPSIVTLGEEGAIDPSIVAATPAPEGPSPSIVALADTPTAAMTSIISLGEPAPAGETIASTPSDGSQSRFAPIVIRGGEIGSADPRPSSSPSQASAPASDGPALLDPNDRGTPSKRKALKRQAERLAQERAKSGQQDTSTPDEPKGM